MKSFLFAALALSLAANAALLAGLLRRPGPTAAASSATASPSVTAAPATPGRSDAPAPGAVATTSPRTGPTAWQLLYDRDPARFAARLAAAGFSRAAQRGAVSALLRDLQAPERQRALDLVPQLPFWQTVTDRTAQMATSREMARLWQEREQTMRRLFPEEQQAFLLQARAQFGPLPDDKLERLSALIRDYGELRSTAMSKTSLGMRMPWVAEELAVVEQEKRRDLAALLSPQELEEFDLRSSSTAQNLRRQLTDFNPTEQEFRVLHAALSPADEARQGTMDFSPEGMNARRQLQQESTKLLQDALGPARYAEYERSIDRGYQVAYTVTQARNLPVENARAAYQLQRDTQQRANEVRRDRNLSAAQRNEQLTAIATEAERTLSTLLTPSGLEDYRRSGGFWLRNLTPQTPPRG